MVSHSAGTTNHSSDSVLSTHALHCNLAKTRHNPEFPSYFFPKSHQSTPPGRPLAPGNPAGHFMHFWFGPKLACTSSPERPGFPGVPFSPGTAEMENGKNGKGNKRENLHQFQEAPGCRAVLSDIDSRRLRHCLLRLRVAAFGSSPLWCAVLSRNPHISHS